MSEIKEAYVSFETAKLLKEKGFSQYLGEEGCINTVPYYTLNGQLITCDINTIRQRYVCEAAAPTKHEAIRWLLNKYGIFIQIELYQYTFEGEMNFSFRVFKHGSWMIIDEPMIFNEPEKAADFALNYSLKNFVNYEKIH